MGKMNINCDVSIHTSEVWS